MENNEHLNLYELKKKYENDIYNFEINAKCILYTELLYKNHCENFINMEFIDLGSNIYNYNFDKKDYNKYICKLINFSFDSNMNSSVNDRINMFLFDIKIIKISNKNIFYNTNQIMQMFPELYSKIKLFCEEKIFVLDKYLDIVQQNNKIITIKQYLLDNYSDNKNKLATELYQYYYSCIDKYIEVGNHTEIKSCQEFYSNICFKYKIPEKNFELDYLQNIFQSKMLLLPNFEIVSYDYGNSIIFENQTHNLKISCLPHRYVNSYHQKYDVCMIKKNNPNDVIKIKYDVFDNDRRLDKYYENIFEFINCTISIIE